jgi:hypothetical protein
MREKPDLDTICSTCVTQDRARVTVTTVAHYIGGTERSRNTHNDGDGSQSVEPRHSTALPTPPRGFTLHALSLTNGSVFRSVD